MKYVKFPFDIIVNAKEILYKYYNINYHFAFIDELGFTMDEISSKKIEDDGSILLFWDITFEAFRKMITDDLNNRGELIKFKDNITDPIIKKTKIDTEKFEKRLTTALEVMYIIAYYVHRKSIIDEAEVEAYYHESARKDLLKLYISSHKVSKHNKIKISTDEQELILDNEHDWFFKVFLADNLKKYLPSIKNVEDAEIKLESFKSKSGRKLDYPEKDIIIYGTYKLLQRLFNMKVKKNIGILNLISRVNLCYLKRCDFSDGIKGFPKGHESIKADIEHIEKRIKKKKKKEEKKKEKEKLVFEGLKNTSLSDFENSGTAPLFMDLYS